MKLFSRKNFLQKNNQRGFSLLETLVAIFILMFAIAGAMSLTQKSLVSSYYSRDQVIASFLAQDAVEYVRNIRDYNYNNSLTSGVQGFWTLGLENCNGFVCKIDTTKAPSDSDAITQCGGEGSHCPALKYDANTGSYGYSVGTDSRFSRDLTLSAVGSESDTVTIDVLIRWTTGSFGEQSFHIKEYMRDWGKIDPGASPPSVSGGGNNSGGNGGDPLEEGEVGEEEELP